MKILMPALHYRPVIGGIETWTTNIAECLSGKAEIFVVTGKVKNQPQKEILKGVKIWRTSLFSLTNLSHSPPIYTLSLLPFIFLKSLILIKKEKINLLHCHGFLSSFLGYLLGKIFDLPYVITVQRMEEKRGFLRKIVYRNAKVCLAASVAIKKYFQEIGCEEIEVIPNGIDLSRFENLNREKSRKKLALKNEFVIMTVARLEKVKGIKYLIKAMSNVKAQMSNVRCLIIGDGSERRNLENLVGKLNLEDKIKFLGQIPNEKIPECLAAADCFCLPSLKEGFGIVILEAGAARIPVVATNVGGIPDIIESGKTGILVPPGNPKALTEAIFKIHSQPDLTQNLVKVARANLNRYDWHKIADKVNQIYLQFALK